MKLTVAILFFTFMNFTLRAQDKINIIYIGDPMCSWCYGFSPEITKVKEHYKDIDFKLVMGGLRPFGKEKINEMANFLTHHWEDVHKASNQPFKYDILKNKEFLYDTEPACRATIVARIMNPTIELEFFKAIQTAFYSDNKNTNNIDTYLELATIFDLDKGRFKELYESDEVKNQTKNDFSLASQMGVRGFPAVIVSIDGKFYSASNGYTKSEILIQNIDKILK